MALLLCAAMVLATVSPALVDAAVLPENTHLQEAEAGIEGDSAPALHGMVADLIHLVHNGQHLLRGHSCCDQTLVSVTQYGLGNFYRSFFNL